MTDPKLDVILRTLRQELAKALGSQLERVVLYGSRARGEARPDSDIDVLIVVRGEVNYPDLMQRTSEIAAGVSLQYDVVVSRTFASQTQFETAQNPFFITVRREGVRVWLRPDGDDRSGESGAPMGAGIHRRRRSVSGPIMTSA